MVRDPGGRWPLERSRLACLLIDRAERVVACNAAAEQLYGVQQEAVIGAPLSDLFRVELPAGIAPADVRRALREEGAWHGEATHVLADGSAREVGVELLAWPHGGPDGQPVTCALMTPRPISAPVGAEVSAGREAPLRAVFDNLPLGLIVAEPGGDILDANAAAADLFGYQRSELLTRRVQDLTSARLGARLGEEHHATGRRWVTRQLTALRADGTELPVEATGSLGRYDGREAVFIVSRDIREEQRLAGELASLVDLARLGEEPRPVAEVAEQAITVLERALSAQRAAVAEFRPDGSVEWLADHGLEAIAAVLPDQAAARRIPFLGRLLDVDRPIFVDRRAPGHPGSGLSPIADRMALTAYAAIPLRAGAAMTGVLALAWESEPPDDAADLELLAAIGRVAGMAIANARLRDVLVARQHELDESERRYRMLFDEAPDPLLLETAEGVVVDANRAAERLYGRSRADMIGRGVTDFSLIDAEELERDRALLMAAGRAVFRATGIRADGTTFPEEVDVVLTSMQGQDHVLVAVHNLTEAERVQAEMLQAQKMEALGQLVSGVAHELNNPLSAIIAFSQLLGSDPRLPVDMRHDAELLTQEADRTRRIVLNLLEFARQRPPERRPTHIGALLERTLELHAYALSAAGISAELDLAPELPPVDVDPNQILQVLLNLTFNAIQAVRDAPPGHHRDGESGHVWIRVRSRRSDAIPVLRVTVEDDGPGVDPAARSRLFEPFFTTKAVGQGTGLGLSVSFGIVASHGGRLWYEPRRGPGSRFIFELPVATGRVRRASPSTRVTTPIAPAARPGRVLAVDDEGAIRAFLARVLRRAGHHVTTAGTGAEALARLAEGVPDVLILDHRMPDVDGVALFGQAVAEHPELRRRTVVMSGDTLNPRLRAFAEQEGLRLLAKPFDLSAVLRVVEEIIACGPAEEGCGQATEPAAGERAPETAQPGERG